MLNEGRSPEFNITSVLSKAWFGVWDTDIIPQPVFSINVSSTYSNKTNVPWTHKDRHLRTVNIDKCYLCKSGQAVV